MQIKFYWSGPAIYFKHYDTPVISLAGQIEPTEDNLKQAQADDPDIEFFALNELPKVGDKIGEYTVSEVTDFTAKK